MELEGMSEGLHKAGSGLIRVLVRVDDGRMDDLLISGDFIMVPEEYIGVLEDRLRGAPAERKEIRRIIDAFFRENEGMFQSPRTLPEDFEKALMNAIDNRGEVLR